MINSLGLTTDDIEKRMAGNIKRSESILIDTMTNQSSTPEGLLRMQKSLGEYTMTIQLQSTLVKELSDTLKSILQKTA
jgi:type III secretion apparatus needle protein